LSEITYKTCQEERIIFFKRYPSVIKENGAAKAEELIRKLNARIRGWANYYRHVVSKETFSYVDHCIFQAIITWIKRRHPNKSLGWMRNKYFRRQHLRNWIFSTKIRKKDEESTNLDLFLASSVKIRCEANPFDPTDKDYFEKRDKRNKISTRDAGQEGRYLSIF
jgi:RNA-directed DNA polymerase